MANWAVGKMNIRGSFEDMNKFVQENFIDNIIIENKDGSIKSETKHNYELDYSFGIAEFLQKADIHNKKSCLDILNVGEAFSPNNVYKVNVSYDHIEDICYISMIMSHRYDIDTKAFVALSKKYNLDFNTVIIDWNECFAHKLRIEKGVIINDEEIEDDDAIYFEFF